MKDIEKFQSGLEIEYGLQPEDVVRPFTEEDIDEWHRLHGIEYEPLSEKQIEEIERGKERIQKN